MCERGREGVQEREDEGADIRDEQERGLVRPGEASQLRSSAEVKCRSARKQKEGVFKEESRRRDEGRNSEVRGGGGDGGRPFVGGVADSLINASLAYARLIIQSVFPRRPYVMVI